MLFTDFIPNADTQFLVGWSMVYCICFNGLINIMIVLGFGGKILSLVCVKYYNKFDHLFEKGCSKMFQKTLENPSQHAEGSSGLTKIFNVMKDPFRVSLSDSDVGESQNE